MNDEPKKRRRDWLVFLIVIAAIFGFALLARTFSSPNATGPEDRQQAARILSRVEGVPIHFGADKAVAIAIEEVKKREGWSSKPEWADVQSDEGPTWDVAVRRMPQSHAGERHVLVSAMTGKVLSYRE